VVRHLEHIRVQRRAGREELPLRGHLDVPAEQHGAGRGRRPDHHGAVVDRGAVVRVDVLRRVLRAHDLQRQRRPREPRPRGDPQHGNARCPGLAADALQRPPRLVDRPDGDAAHGPAAQRPGEPADVIRVKVTDQHEGNRRDAQPAQARVDRPVVRPDVHEHRPPRLPGGQDQRVALADVARDQRPARGRPAGPPHPGRHQYQQQPDDGRKQQRPDPTDASEQRDHQRECHEQPGPRPAVRPRQDRTGHRGRSVRHSHEPGHRRTSQARAPGRGGRRQR
jgi:hypothetical protein